MITFLSRIFIKNYNDFRSPAVRKAYGILCGTVGIMLNIFLFIGKWIAGTISGSIAITADAFNNLSDVGSSVVTLFGFKLSGHKADLEHPFGHGRIEYISGLLVSVIILIMGIELIKTSIGKIIHPEPIESSPLIVAILVASILVKVYMGFYNHVIGRKIKSSAMTATSKDSLSDTLSTTLVLAATIVSHFTGILIDGWFGVLVGLFIVYTGLSTMKESIDPLLGQAPGKELVEEIWEIVMSHPHIYGIHDLIVHDYGPGNLIISLHAEVPATGDILAIHDEIDNTERELRETLNCVATIHMDPVVTDDKAVNQLRALVAATVKEIDTRLSIHDFRVVEGPTHTNLIFDVLVPYSYAATDEEVVTDINQKISEIPENTYFAVIQIDRDYC